jgi:hypothetical protein
VTLLNTANAVRVGSSLASKVYAGSTQVWPPAGFVDISANLGYQEPSVYTSPAWLNVPGWGQNYEATINAARVGANTWGVGVRFAPVPNPNQSYTVTVRYKAADWKRRIFHTMPMNAIVFGYAWFEHVDGLLIEPDVPVGNPATITYRWDVALQAVVVDSYTGPVLIRDYGPGDEATHLIPLYFSPEAKATTNFALAKASHQKALTAVPLAHRQMMARQGTIICCPEQGQPLQNIFDRHIFDGAYGSGASGIATGGPLYNYVYANLTGVYDSTGGTLEARTMLHELGHVVSNAWQYDAGVPYGRAPYVAAPGASTTYYWPNTSIVQYVVVELGEIYSDDGTLIYGTVRVDNYDSNGNFVNSDYYGGSTGRQGKLEMEQDIYHLWLSVKSNVTYFRSEVDEFVAECFAIYYGSLMSGVNPNILADMKASVGGAAVYDKFVDYMKSAGVIAGAPSDSTPPGPVTNLTAGTVWNATEKKVTLAWTSPVASDLSSFIIRRTTGATPAATANDGVLVASHGPLSSTARDYGVVPNTTYTYAVWARDFSGNYSTRATVTITTPGA